MWFLKPECKNVDTASRDDYWREAVFSIVCACSCPDLLFYCYYASLRAGGLVIIFFVAFFFLFLFYFFLNKMHGVVVNNFSASV